MTEPNAITRKRALKLRARIKKGKPKFARPESWRYVRLKENWRNPRGLDNKVRMYIKGWPPPVSSGYGGPRVSRGLHPSGYEEILVYNVEQVSKVAPSTQAMRIAHTVGKRKRTQILAEARKRKIVVLNLTAGQRSSWREVGRREGRERRGRSRRNASTTQRSGRSPCNRESATRKKD